MYIQLFFEALYFIQKKLNLKLNLMYFIQSQANLELFKLPKSKEFWTPYNPRLEGSEQTPQTLSSVFMTGQLWIPYFDPWLSFHFGEDKTKSILFCWKRKLRKVGKLNIS